MSKNLLIWALLCLLPFVVIGCTGCASQEAAQDTAQEVTRDATLEAARDAALEAVREARIASALPDWRGDPELRPLPEPVPPFPLWEGDPDTGAAFIQLIRNGDEPGARNHLSRWPADINFRDEAGRTGLMRTIESGNLVMLRTILSVGAPRLDPNIVDNLGRTALHLAVANNMDDMAEMLLQDHNINTRLADINGDTAFIIAVRNNSQRMIRAFGENPRFDVTFSPRGSLPPLLYALDRSLPPSTIRAILHYCRGAIESRDSRGNGPFDYLEHRSRHRSEDMEDIRDMLTEADIRQRAFR